MKLEGSLDAFSLPDVFQLLSLTKKSGGLHLTNGQVNGVVYFSAGAVTGATADHARQGLARRLVGIGVIDDSGLRRAVERAATDTETGISRALLDGGAVDTEVLKAVAVEHTVDAVFDLLRWNDGEFAFALDETNPDDVGISIPSEEVVSEARLRRETWEAVSRVIPSPAVVLVMPVVLRGEPVLSADEWTLLSLVDGRRSVGDIVEVSGAGQYGVVSSLATLVQRGLLSIQDDDALDHVALVRRRQQLLAPLEGGGVAGAATEPPQVSLSGTSGSATPAAPGSSGDALPGPPVPADRPEPVAAEAAELTALPGDPVEREASTAPNGTVLVGGAHLGQAVVPSRPEPFRPPRQPDHPEPEPRTGPTVVGSTVLGSSAFGPPMSGGRSPSSVGSVSGSPGAASAAVATQPTTEAVIDRDPSVNRSLLLRLIAGVRGL